MSYNELFSINEFECPSSSSRPSFKLYFGAVTK